MVSSVASGGKFYQLLPDKENTGAYLRWGLCRRFMLTMILRANSDWQQSTFAWKYKNVTQLQGSYKKIATILKDFSRTAFDFQGPPTRNVISQIVQKCKFPVNSNGTLRPELFAPPHSLHCSVRLS